MHVLWMRAGGRWASMANVLLFGNVVSTDGFGRIGNELLKRLQLRGHTVAAAGIFTEHVPYGWPYQVWGLQGHDLWGELQQLSQASVNGRPWDVLLVCQDFPYLLTAAQLPRIDYSRTALIGITPVDGAPIDEEWIAACPRFDALYTISRFGTNTFRLQGGRDRYGGAVELLLPGVDRNEFRPASLQERSALRQQAGIKPDAYVLGAFMANQGRKQWPEVEELFGRFRALHAPEAVLIADTDRQSPAGWRLDSLARQIAAYRGIQPFREAILFREDLQRSGLGGLRERYVLCDVALQLASREGYGLPIAEAQSCGVLTLAQNWCSGTELCGNGRGLLCDSKEPGRFGTWGNAIDKDPDLDHALAILVDAYRHPGKAAAIRETALEAVKRETWDGAADVLDDGIRRVLERRAASQQQYITSVVQHGAVPGPIGPIGPAAVVPLALDAPDSALRLSPDGLVSGVTSLVPATQAAGVGA